MFPKFSSSPACPVLAGRQQQKSSKTSVTPSSTTFRLLPRTGPFKPTIYQRLRNRSRSSLIRGVDSPTDEMREAFTSLEREGVLTRIAFLDADDDVIVRRYTENRRPHPLGLDTISESIAAERELLGDLKEMADVVIDTSNLNVHELRERLTAQFSSDDTGRPMRVSVRSFGFKHGAPRDADLIFDVRFSPQPLLAGGAP